MTHPANDYWQPLPAILMSVPMRLLGASLLPALLPGIAAGLALCPLLWAWARLHSPYRTTAFGAALLVLVEPTLFVASLGTGSVLYATLFVSLSLLLMVRGQADPRGYVWAGAAGGVAALVRPEAHLLPVTLLLTALGSPRPRAVRLRWAALGVAAHVALVLPLLAHNYRVFGSVTPPGQHRVLFITRYEDLFAPAEALSLASYLAWGPRNILLSKLGAGLANLEALGGLFGLVWIVVLAEGLHLVLRRRERAADLLRHAPALIFLVLAFLLHTLVTTYTGGSGLLNGAVSLVPFLLLVAVDALRRHGGRTVALLGIAILAAHFTISALARERQAIAERNSLVAPLEAVRTLIARDGQVAPERVVLMTRTPWELHHSTGYRAVQIPNGDLETILAVARRYGVTHLLLPAPRPALGPLYRGEVADPRFEPIGTVPDGPLALGGRAPFRLFRLHLEGGG